MKVLLKPEICAQVDHWLTDVTAEPPSRPVLAAYFCQKLGVRLHFWNKKEIAAIYVTAGALLEMRDMVVREEERRKTLADHVAKQQAELAQSLRLKKAAIQHALDAQTVTVVMRHRMAVAEEVALAVSAGGGPRLEKALAAYRALEAGAS